MATIHESASVSGATAVGAYRYKVLIISEGEGSSGFYSAEALQDAADRKVIPANTHAYFDHPKPGDLPERSLRDLAGAFATDAVWDEALRGLVAEVKVFAPFRDVIADMQESIGLSIRGTADVGDDGVVQRLNRIDSVDFVTKAGRGGRVLQVIESARSVSEVRPAWSDLSSDEQGVVFTLRSSGLSESAALAEIAKDRSGGDAYWDHLFSHTARATR